MHIYHDDIGQVELIDFMGDDKAIVDAARVSFARDVPDAPFDDIKDKQLIRYLMRNKHMSPFEHCVLKFHFTVPLFVRSQHHRHRTWAYNEISRRYTSDDLQFYEPDTFRVQHESNKQGSVVDSALDPRLDVNHSLLLWTGGGTSASGALKLWGRMAVAFFHTLLAAGVAREQARMVLPQNLYTRYYGTVNLRNALAFLVLRDDAHAQWEIQQVAKAMRALMVQQYPVTMAVFDELRAGT